MDYDALDYSTESCQIPFTEAAIFGNAALQLGLNTRGTLDTAHLVTGEYKSIGCHWKVTATRLTWITTAQDWNRKTGARTKLCKTCFRTYCLPDDWNNPDIGALDTALDTASNDGLSGPDASNHSSDADDFSSDDSDGVDSDGAETLPPLPTASA